MTFQEYKDTYFAGDTAKALEQLARESCTGEYTLSKTAEELKVILNSMDKKTTNEYADYLRDEIKKNPKKLNDAMNIAMLCGYVGMDLEEVHNAKKNPFVKEFWLKMLLVLGVIAVYAVLLLLKEWLDIEWEAYSYVVSVIPLVFVSSVSYTTATSFLNVFRFRKLKKYVANNPQVVAPEDSAVTQEPPAADAGTALQEKEQITRTHIFKFLRDYYRNLRSASLAFGIIFIVLFGVMAVADGVQFWPIAALLLSLFGLLFVSIRVNKRLKKAEAMEFCVVIDKCVNKKVEVDSENNRRRYHLFFERYGKHHINHQHAGLFIGDVEESAVYESIDIGESCYVVLFTSENKIQMAMPVKSYCLRAEEFTLNNGVYYPIKNETTSTLISKEVQEQWQDLSDRQRMAIDETYKRANKAKAKTRGLVICSVIGIFFTVLGAFLEFVCALNLFIQPLLFTVPLVISLVAVIKSKAAIKEVRMDYADYSELNHMHNSAAGKTFAFLALDIIAYLLNFFIIIGVYS